MLEYLFGPSDDVTDEYWDDYVNNDVEDYGISYEDYAESRTNEDYWGQYLRKGSVLALPFFYYVYTKIY